MRDTHTVPVLNQVNHTDFVFRLNQVTLLALGILYGIVEWIRQVSGKKNIRVLRVRVGLERKENNNLH